MKHATDYLEFQTPNRRDHVNITPQVEAFVRASGIREGLCLVSPMHITAAVYVNDDEGGPIADIDDWLERLAPHEPTSQSRHNNGEDNADAHLKRQLMFLRPPSRIRRVDRSVQTAHGQARTPEIGTASGASGSCCRSRRGSSTWARGSSSSTPSSTGGGASGSC
jgi:secondary thiamine-phosphate synthase enzyme